jgi:hypothetical protein
VARRLVRCAHFRVLGRLDGATSGTVTIEYHNAGTAFFRVRPLRRRRAFELLLADVARSVIYDVTKAELRAKRAGRKAGR